MSPERQPDDAARKGQAPDAEEPAVEDPAAARAARRARRRKRAARVFDTSVPSPCIQVCQVDPKSDCCIGCGRHIDEIRDWPILSAEEKKAVLALLPERTQKR
ncbi:DUF1289 domain-containing protein [Pelagibius sp.]|uniref:DUF1289 domain-containing protein n=1 Tax=Pelagibius sp. TaxID=1931238 RepID=UPI003B506FD2